MLAFLASVYLIFYLFFSVFFPFVFLPSSLSTNQGLNLMELLAESVNLRVTDFLQLS